MEVGSSLYTITNKLLISDCQAPVFGVSFRWWSPCLDSDLSPRSCGGACVLGVIVRPPPRVRAGGWIACCVLHATCYMLHATYYMLRAACCVLVWLSARMRGGGRVCASCQRMCAPRRLGWGRAGFAGGLAPEHLSLLPWLDGPKK